MTSAHTETTTAERILAVADRIFAERGFHQATIREICDAAGANVAAVNYHFGGKEGLYRVILERAYDEKTQQARNIPAGGPAQDRLREFVGSILRGFAADQPSWRERLLYREMAEPTGALAEVIERSVRPTAMVLRSIVAELLGEGADATTVTRCALSVIGQCSHYHFAGRVVAMLYPELPRGPDAQEELADHIVRFSLGGIAAMRRKDGASHV